jgi:hypothetical protein
MATDATNKLDPGTCAFCGFGDGWLGEQGDETTQRLHSAVRTGEPGDWNYEPFPGSRSASTITWCGNCVGGLKHKYQRYDDSNLRALQVSYKVRLSLDGIRWDFWEYDEDERKKVIEAGRHPDDPAVHMEKLRIERDLQDIQNEIFRRYGHDLTQQGWRP